MRALHCFRSADRRFGLALPAEALRTMLELARQAEGNETGGILVGQYDHTHTTAVVVRAEPPPADSRAGSTWFERGIQGLAQKLERYWHSRQRTYYLGEWHVHPEAGPSPSGVDVATMRDNGLKEAFRCSQPVLLIVGTRARRQPELSAWVFTESRTAIVLLESPLASEMPGR